MAVGRGQERSLSLEPSRYWPATGRHHSHSDSRAITFCHFLNDVATSLLPAIYPMLKSSFDLSFAQIGVITLIYQGIASLFQPIVGLYTDHRPQPYSLPFGMTCTLLGLAVLAFAPSFLVYSPARHYSEWAQPSSIRSLRGSRGSPRAALTVSHNRCFRSVAMSAIRSRR